MGSQSFIEWQQVEAKLRDRRVEKVRSDIIRRFRVICCDMPEADFEALVEKMVSQQLRSEGILPS